MRCIGIHQRTSSGVRRTQRYEQKRKSGSSQTWADDGPQERSGGNYLVHFRHEDLELLEALPALVVRLGEQPDRLAPLTQPPHHLPPGP